jgi:hypothetical protein
MKGFLPEAVLMSEEHAKASMPMRRFTAKSIGRDGPVGQASRAICTAADRWPGELS